MKNFKNYLILTILSIITLACGSSGGSEAPVSNPVQPKIFEYIENSTGITITKYIGTEKKVIVPANIDGKKVTIIGNNAFNTVVAAVNQNSKGDNPKNIKRVRINELLLPEGLISIEDNAFANNDLVSLSLPKTIKNIGTNAFLANKISNIALNEGLQTIGNGAFNGNNISELTIPSTIVSIGEGAFQNNNITTVNLPETTDVAGEAFDNGVTVEKPSFNKIVSIDVALKNGAVFYRNDKKSAHLNSFLVKVVYSDNKNVKVDYQLKSYNILWPDMSTLGNKTVYIEIGKIKQAINIDVKESPISSMDIVVKPGVVFYVGDLKENHLNSFSVKITRIDGRSENINLIDSMITKFDTAKIGATNVEFNIENFIKNVAVNITENKIVELNLTLNSNANIYIGDLIDSHISKFILSAKYSNGISEIIPINAGMFSKFDTSKVGISDVIVSYTGITATTKMNVLENNIVALNATVNPNTKFYVGDLKENHLQSFVVKVTKTNGKIEDVVISPEMITRFVTSRVGNSVVEFKIGNVVTTVTINVLENVLINLTATIKPNVIFYQNDTIDKHLNSFELKGEYINGVVKTLTLGPEMFFRFDTTILGNSNIEFIVGQNKANCLINIVKNDVKSLEILVKPNTIFYEGDTKEKHLNSFIAKVTRLNGFVEELPVTLEMITKFDTSVVGEKIIEFKLGTLLATTKVNVIKNNLVSLTASVKPNVVFYEGDSKEKHLNSFELKGRYQNGIEKTIPLTIDMITGFMTNILGSSNVEFTIGVIKANCLINVVKNDIKALDISVKPNVVFYMGDTKDKHLNSFIAKVTRTNGIVEELPITIDMINKFDTSSIGLKNIEFSVGNILSTVQINISENKMVSLIATVKPNAKFYQGDAKEKHLGSIELKGKYLNNDEKLITITADMIKVFNSTNIGKTVIELSLDNLKTTLEINIEKVILIDYSLKSILNTKFYQNDNKEKHLKNFEIIGIYNNGSNQIITPTSTMITKFDTSTLGLTMVEFNINNIIKNCEINVIKNNILRYILEVKPGVKFYKDQPKYKHLNSFIFKSVMENGDKIDHQVTLTQSMITSYNPYNIGHSTVNILYNNKTYSVYIDVVPNPIVGIKAKVRNGEKIYINDTKSKVAFAYDLITVHESGDEFSKIKLKAENVTFADTSKLGMTTIKFMYNNFTTTHQVEVIDTTYEYGGDKKIEDVYETDTLEDIINKYEFYYMKNGESAVLDKKYVTLSYNGGSKLIWGSNYLKLTISAPFLEPKERTLLVYANKTIIKSMRAYWKEGVTIHKNTRINLEDLIVEVTTLSGEKKIIPTGQYYYSGDLLLLSAGKSTSIIRYGSLNKYEFVFDVLEQGCLKLDVRLNGYNGRVSLGDKLELSGYIKIYGYYGALGGAQTKHELSLNQVTVEGFDTSTLGYKNMIIRKDGARYEVSYIVQPAYDYVNNIDGISITNYYGNVLSNLIIPDTIEGKTVTEISDTAFSNKMLSSRVTLPVNLKRIGANAFSSNRISDVEIPTKVETIGNKAFVANPLNRVKIPMSTTNIGDGAFLSDFSNDMTYLELPFIFKSRLHNIFNNIISAEIKYVKSEIDRLELKLRPNINFIYQNYSINGCINDFVMYLHYIDGTKEEIKLLPEYFTVFNTNIAGVTKISVNYKNNIASCDVTIKEHEFKYEEINSEIKITGYNNIGTNVLIPEIINGLPVVRIGNEAFYKDADGDGQNDYQISEVIFPKTIKSIETRAFYKNNLSTLKLPKGLVSISASAFAENKITKIYTFDEFDKLSQELPVNLNDLGGRAFSDNLLTDIIIHEGILNLGNYIFDNNKLKYAAIHERHKYDASVIFGNNPGVVYSYIK